MSGMTRAPFRIDRIASLPGAALDFAHHVSSTDLDAAIALIRDLGGERDAAAEAIHDAVPTATPEDRRLLLRLRRDLHNGRSPRERDVAVARRTLPPALLDRLENRERELEAARSRLEQGIAIGSAAAEQAVRGWLRDRAVSDALRLLAPGFVALLDKPAPAGTQRARSSLAYLSRCVMKPSPLSTLTRTSITGAGLGGRRSALSPIIAWAILTTLAKEPGLLPDLRYRSTVRRVEGDVVVATPRFAMVSGAVVVFGERTVRVRSGDADVLTLMGWEGGDASSLLALAGGPDSRTRARRWVDSGLVEATVPWDDETDACGALAGLAKRSTDESVRAAGDSLDTAAEAARSVARRSGAQRTREIRRAEGLLASTAAHLGMELPRIRLIDEDAGVARGEGRDLDDEACRAVDEWVRPHLFRSYVYDVLLDAFIQRHGHGGIASDAYAFLAWCGGDDALRPALARARARDREASQEVLRDRASLPAGRTSAPPSAAVLYQSLAGEGDQEFVVNQISSGLGSIAARCHRLAKDGGAFREMLRSWITSCYPGVDRIVSFVPGGEVNALQRSTRGVLPELGWNREAASFASLRMVHDPDRDVLELEDEAGRPVAPVPLGIVPAWTYQGALSLAMHLLDPWIERTSLTASTNPVRRSQPEEVARFTERESRGPLVTRRRTWRFPTAVTPQPAPRERPVQFMVRLHEWRRSNGIPDEVFVRVHGVDPFDAQTRKPLWVNLTDWYSVSGVWTLIKGRHTIEIQECLPRRVSTGRVVESVAFFAWPRPDNGDRRGSVPAGGAS